MNFTDAKDKFLIGAISYIAVAVTSGFVMLINIDKKQAVLEYQIKKQEEAIAKVFLKDEEQDKRTDDAFKRIVQLEAVLPSDYQKKRTIEGE